MREQEKPVFQRSSDTLTTTRDESNSEEEFRSNRNRDTRDSRDSRDSRDYSRKPVGTGAGTWSLETLKKLQTHSCRHTGGQSRSSTSRYPPEPEKEEPKKPELSSAAEFPDLAPESVTASASAPSDTTSFANKLKSVWGTKKEVIDTIKTASMSEINTQEKANRRKEKNAKYIEQQQWDYQLALAKKKRDWLNRIKRQYAKDCNYRHINDIITEEGLQFNYDTEIDPEIWLQEQMLYETNNRQLRIDTVQYIDHQWYRRETALCVLAEWAHSNEDYDVVEERVYRRT
jgi:hypothetical protein